MKVDPYCPVDLLNYDIVLDDRGNARVYIKLRNLSKRTVEKLTARVVWRNRLDESFSCEVEISKPARAGSVFTLITSTDKPKYAKDIEFLVLRIAFSGVDKVWLSDERNVLDVPKAPFADAAEMRKLACLAGDDAVTFPVSDEMIWMCVCSRVNPDSYVRCVRCGRDKDDVMSLYTKKAVEKTEYTRKRTLNTTLPISLNGRDDSDKARLRLKKRSMLFRRTVTVMCLAFIVVLWALIAAEIR